MPNLEPQKVVLVTNSGQVLSTLSLDEAKDVPGIEEKYKGQVSYLLNGIFNSDDYKISVSVAMDYKKKVTVEENYYPNKATGTGFLAKRKSVERSGGETDLGETSRSTRNDEEEYLFSKEHSEIVYSTGEIKKIAVGIVINKPLLENERLNIEKLIFNSLGMVESRGDKISIFIADKPDQKTLAIAFPDAPMEKPQSIRISKLDTFLIANKIYILITMLVLMLLIALSLVLYIRIRNAAEKSTIVSDAQFKQLSEELKEWMQRS